MKEVDESKTQTLNDELEKRFKQERDDWNEKLTDVVKAIGNTKKLSETQVYALSYRQQLVEKLTEYRILSDKRQESYDKLIQKRSEAYENQSARKLSAVEKKVYLSGDYAALNRQIKMIDRQIYYFEESIKTLDNLNFAIKNRIEIISQQLM